MVIGVGVDIVSIKKIQRAVQRWKSDFLTKVFHDDEIAPLRQGKMFYQRLGARFAAKEAVFKAVSAASAVSLKEIRILSDKNGAPFCVIDRKDLANISVKLSLTHIEEYALACAVAEKKP